MKLLFFVSLLLLAVSPSMADWDQRAEYIRAVHHYKLHGYWLTKATCERYRDTIHSDVEEFCYELHGLVVNDPSEADQYEDEIYALWTTEDFFVNNMTNKIKRKNGKTVKLPLASWSFSTAQLTVGTANDVLKIWRRKQKNQSWENGSATPGNPIPTLLARYPGFITGRDLLTDTDLSFAIGIWHYLGRRQAFLKSKKPLQTAVRCYNCGEGGLKKGLSFGYWDSVHDFLTYKHLWRRAFSIIPGKEKLHQFNFISFVHELQRGPHV